MHASFMMQYQNNFSQQTQFLLFFSAALLLLLNAYSICLSINTNAACLGICRHQNSLEPPIFHKLAGQLMKHERIQSFLQELNP
jgi:hypothetical protein